MVARTEFEIKAEPGLARWILKLDAMSGALGACMFLVLNLTDGQPEDLLGAAKVAAVGALASCLILGTVQW